MPGDVAFHLGNVATQINLLILLELHPTLAIPLQHTEPFLCLVHLGHRLAVVELLLGRLSSVVSIDPVILLERWPVLLIAAQLSCLQLDHPDLLDQLDLELFCLLSLAVQVVEV